MYVVFPVSTRTVLDLQRRTAGKPDSIIVRIRLPDGHLYGRVGRLDFIDNTVAGNTDTMILRGVVPNPPLAGHGGDAAGRELVDGELVTVVLEDAQPVETLTIPRAAVLTDQSGDYVYVVGADDKAQQRRVQLGQSSPTTASVTNGLKEGENVIVEGIQRVLPGRAVSPGPASSQTHPPVPGTPANGAPGGRG
jgi:membrane fusion protein (multidrug efflux system)